MGGVSPDGEITAPEERAIAGDTACLQRALEATMAAIVSDEPASELTELVETAEAGELPASASENAPTTVSSAAYSSKTVAAIPAGFTWNSDSSPFVAIPVATPNNPPSFNTGMQWIQTRGADNSISYYIQNRNVPSYMDWSTDGCSAPLVGSGPYDFGWACNRHDFGWRNLKGISSKYGKPGWNAYNKSVSDTQFSEDMDTRCFLHHNINACYAASDAYAAAVRANQINTNGMINQVFRW